VRGNEHACVCEPAGAARCFRLARLIRETARGRKKAKKSTIKL